VIIVWRVTQNCNLSCPFCTYDHRQSFPRTQVDGGKVRKLGSLLAEYRRRTGQRVLVSWLGGEPLLWKPVFELSRWLHQSCGIEISATTNGTTLRSAHVREQILAFFSELTFSVDGLEDFHVRMRGWPGGWEYLRASIRALSNTPGRQLRLRANIVLMHDNLPMFAELCDTLATWGIDEITFNQLGGRDRPEFYPAHRLRPEDVRQLSALLPELYTRLAHRGVRLCGTAGYIDRIDASANDHMLAVADCQPGETFLFIDEFGWISPCSFTTRDYGRSIAQLLSVDDLLDLPRMFSVARGRMPSAECSDCPSTRVFAKFAV